MFTKNYQNDDSLNNSNNDVHILNLMSKQRASNERFDNRYQELCSLKVEITNLAKQRSTILLSKNGILDTSDSSSTEVITEITGKI